MALLILLGGPPGVGKSSVCAQLSRKDWCHVEADHVSPPDSDASREDAIDEVVTRVESELSANSVVALSWVFARRELFQPFLERFSPLHDLEQVYLVCAENELAARLDSRDSADLFGYSLSRLRLINDLPFEIIDTTNMEVDDVATHLFERFQSPPNEQLLYEHNLEVFC